MVETTGEIVIARPRADVFAVLADPTRIPAWRADIIEAAPLDDTRGIGARYREVMMLRKMIPSKWRSYAEALKTTLEA